MIILTITSAKSGFTSRSISLFKTCILIGILFLINSCQSDKKISESRWQYCSNQPAKIWQEALLTGNGKHGTMVFGVPDSERIICVHEELFMPHIDPDINPVVELKGLLPEVRHLVLNNKSTEAGQLMLEEANRQFEEAGLPPALHWGPTTHPAFDLFLIQNPVGPVKNYKRQLDLETGEVLVSWQDNEGSFEEHKFKGLGKYFWPNGSRYEGGYKDNKFSGHGKRVWPNGSSYEGNYKEGKRHGSGTFTFSNGKSCVVESHEGKWLEPPNN